MVPVNGDVHKFVPVDDDGFRSVSVSGNWCLADCCFSLSVCLFIMAVLTGCLFGCLSICLSVSDRVDGVRNESVYESCCMGSRANGVNCGVVEWVKRNKLRWFGHSERMGSEEFVMKVYMSESVGPNIRGRPPGRWRDRVKEYLCERVATRGRRLDQAKRECLDRERWRLFCRGDPLGGRSRRERDVRAIDR